jgi:hypothetical protein
MDGIIALIVVVVFSIIVVKGMGMYSDRTSSHPVKRRHNKWHR